MDLLQAIVYGIVQGLTEWLPISSTAHLRIVPAFMGWQDPGSAFTATIQLGTLAAVLVFFRHDLKTILAAWFKSLKDKQQTPESKIGWGIFWGTMPILIIGFLAKDYIQGPMRSMTVIGTALIVMGLLMIIAEKTAKGHRNFEDITVKDGLIVGAFQAISLIPGASRSGSTITGALFAGLDRPTAARYSFLLSVPSVFAAGFYEAYSEREHLFGNALMHTLVATVFAFIFGYASISFFIKLLQKHSILPFVIYRVILGSVILYLASTGWFLQKRLEPNIEGGHTPVVSRVP